MSTTAIQKIRQVELWISTSKTAVMLDRSVTWIQDNRHLLTYRRKNGGRSLEFELSSIIEYHEKNQSE